MICPAPASLGSVLLIANWRKRYDCLVAWVFDSFWPDHVPKFVRLGRLFDHVFVTEQEDLKEWRRRLHAPVDWLPWGSDTLSLGSLNPARPVDLLRIGRQPPDWEDDAATSATCTSLQLRFRGRPPFFTDPSEGERALMSMLAQTKFALSFSNIVNPGLQTHPQRAYVTARWTDALSAGATVAGIPPRSETVRSLLWEDGMLDLGTVDRIKGLEVIAQAVRDWTPRQAVRNYLRSLEVLDWRWRFEKLASTLNIHPPKLASELELLRRTINDCRLLI